MPAAVENDLSPQWLTLKAARQILGRAPSTVVRLALIGRIRTKADPGIPLKYSRVDVERIARQAPHPRRRPQPGGV
jgi:hypothetical protein